MALPVNDGYFTYLCDFLCHRALRPVGSQPRTTLPWTLDDREALCGTYAAWINSRAFGVDTLGGRPSNPNS
jgi:hypothetical protein